MSITAPSQPAQEFHPLWLCGTDTGRLCPRSVMALLVSPFFACVSMLVVMNVMDFMFMAPWYAPIIPGFGVLGLLVLTGAALILMEQRAHISLSAGQLLVLGGRLAGAFRCPVSDMRGYSRKQSTDAGAWSTVLLFPTCGCMTVGAILGILFAALMLWSVQFGVKEHEVIPYLVETLIYFLAAPAIVAPGVFLPFIAGRLTRSDGTISIRLKEGAGRRRWPFASATSLHVRASRQDLDTLQAWLEAAGVTRTELPTR